MRILKFGILVILLLPFSARAASGGSPALVIGQENYGITLELEKQVNRIDGDLVRSERYLSKLIWGPISRVNLYARLGASKLKVEVPSADDFKGAPGATYGGGIRVLLAETERPRIAVYADAQALSFYSKGELLVEAGQYTDKYVDRYKWNEYQFSVVVCWLRDMFSPYAGFGVTSISGNVKKKMYRIGSGIEEFIGEASNTFSEDAIPELILGVDIGLGGTGRFSGELRYSEDQDISFFIGLSELYK